MVLGRSSETQAGIELLYQFWRAAWTSLVSSDNNFIFWFLTLGKAGVSLERAPFYTSPIFGSLALAAGNLQLEVDLQIQRIRVRAWRIHNKCLNQFPGRYEGVREIRGQHLVCEVCDCNLAVAEGKPRGNLDCITLTFAFGREEDREMWRDSVPALASRCAHTGALSWVMWPN